MMNKNIRCIPFGDINHASVVISCHKCDNGNKLETCMSFFFDNGNVGAEWEPNYGPITKIIRLQKEDEGAIPHWFYDYYAGQGHWSQLAVNESGINNAFIEGDYNRMFLILKEWAIL